MATQFFPPTKDILKTFIKQLGRQMESGLPLLLGITRCRYGMPAMVFVFLLIQDIPIEYLALHGRQMENGSPLPLKIKQCIYGLYDRKEEMYLFKKYSFCRLRFASEAFVVVNRLFVCALASLIQDSVIYSRALKQMFSQKKLVIHGP